MKVKIIRGVMADGKGYLAGTDATLSDNTAKMLIGIGKAVPIESEAVEIEDQNQSPTNRMESPQFKRGRKTGRNK